MVFTLRFDQWVNPIFAVAFFLLFGTTKQKRDWYRSINHLSLFAARTPSLTVQPKQPIDTHIREMMLCNTIISRNYIIQIHYVIHVYYTINNYSVALLTQWSPNRDFMYKCKCIYVSKYNLNWLGLATFRIN